MKSQLNVYNSYWRYHSLSLTEIVQISVTPLIDPNTGFYFVWFVLFIGPVLLHVQTVVSEEEVSQICLPAYIKNFSFKMSSVFPYQAGLQK